MAAAPSSSGPAWTGMTMTAGVPTGLGRHERRRGQAHDERDLRQLLGSLDGRVDHAAQHLAG